MTNKIPTKDYSSLKKPVHEQQITSEASKDVGIDREIKMIARH